MKTEIELYLTRQQIEDYLKEHMRDMNSFDEGGKRMDILEIILEDMYDGDLDILKNHFDNIYATRNNINQQI